MSYILNYPLLQPLEKLDRHDQLPKGCEVIGSVIEGDGSSSPALYFIQREGRKLSILETCVTKWKTGPVYSCDQYDFPIGVLSWFPKALEEFRKPPAEGGLPAGAMIGKDEDVDGEMLAVGSTTRGYNITNWSRDAEGVDADPDYYEPTTLSLDYELLYEHGLLDLWKSLGEKFERGEL